MMTVRDVASSLGVSLSKAYRLCQEGKLSHYRLEGSIRVHPEDLARYLEGCRIGSRQPMGKAPQGDWRAQLRTVEAKIKGTQWQG
jgi:excisionase family DNA binding protein